MAAGNDGFEGNGRELHDAISDAHAKAAHGGHSGKWLRVHEIHVRGENPISEYRVILRPGP